MKTNKELLQAMYDAFSQGNIPFILDSVSDDFTWFDPAYPSIASHGGTYHGKAGLGQFFQNLVSCYDTTHFAAHDFIAEGAKVVATGVQAFILKSNGKTGEFQWAMVWEFKDGKATQGRNYYDTARYEAMYN